MITVTHDEYSNSAERKKIIKKVASVLTEDSIIIAPVLLGYAYVSSGNSEFAMSRIKELKGMAPEISLVRLVANVEQIEALCGSLTSEQIRLLEKYWPGPLIAERATIPELRYSFGSRRLPDTLFFTQASNSLLAGVCRAIGPLAFSPIIKIDHSSNGRKALTALEQLPISANESISLVIEGTGVWSTAQSTLISLSGVDVKLTKAGEITAEMIREVVPRAQVNSGN